VNENGTALIQGKSAKHDNLFSGYKFVSKIHQIPGRGGKKRYKMEENAKKEKQKSNDKTAKIPERTYTIRIVEIREDGTPVI
jgi:hypothetical protein